MVNPFPPIFNPIETVTKSNIDRTPLGLPLFFLLEKNFGESASDEKGLNYDHLKTEVFMSENFPNMSSEMNSSHPFNYNSQKFEEKKCDGFCYNLENVCFFFIKAKTPNHLCTMGFQKVPSEGIQFNT